MPPRNRPVVLHVAGAGRSGSTLLGGLLGQVAGFCNVGELGYLWERGLALGGDCGCGEPVRTCGLWSAVLARAFGVAAGPSPGTVATLREWHTALTRGRDVLSLHAAGRLRHATERLVTDHEYPALIARMYHAIGEVTGCGVIVDTTKPVTYGHLLTRIPDLDLRVVHLVRDPRAVAWSWLRVKTEAGAGASSGADTMATRPVLTSSLLWRAANVAAARLVPEPERAGRYLAVRYEDLVTDPQTVLQAIVALADPSGPALPMTGPSTARLAPTHTVAGNIDRHRSGEVRLRLDDEWARSMPGSQRRLVEAATTPVRLRYGYRGGGATGAGHRSGGAFQVTT